MALAPAAGVLILIAAAWFLVTSTSTTVIVVRHAPQILGVNGDDPPLSAEGEARAAALARMLGDTRLKSRVAAIYVFGQAAQPRHRRCRSRECSGITPEVVSQADARALARRVLREHFGDGRIDRRARRYAAHDRLRR